MFLCSSCLGVAGFHLLGFRAWGRGRCFRPLEGRRTAHGISQLRGRIDPLRRWSGVVRSPQKLEIDDPRRMRFPPAPLSVETLTGSSGRLGYPMSDSGASVSSRSSGSTRWRRQSIRTRTQVALFHSWWVVAQHPELWNSLARCVAACHHGGGLPTLAGGRRAQCSTIACRAAQTLRPCAKMSETFRSSVIRGT